MSLGLAQKQQYSSQLAIACVHQTGGLTVTSNLEDCLLCVFTFGLFTWSLCKCKLSSFERSLQNAGKLHMLRAKSMIFKPNERC